MSALAMILTAVMMVPGDGGGSEKVSMEITRRLDLRGEWEGSFDDPKNITKNCRFKYGRSTSRNSLPYILGTLWTKDQGYVEMAITDEGKGCLKVAREIGSTLGIYQQDGDKLVVCFCRREGASRPTSFQANGKQHLIVLHRVKSRK